MSQFDNLSMGKCVNEVKVNFTSDNWFLRFPCFL